MSPITTVTDRAKNSPVAFFATLEALVLGSGTTATVNDAFGGVEVPAWVKVFAPVIAVLVPILAHAAAHALVTPWNKVQVSLEKTGLFTDTDIARIGAMLDDHKVELLHDVLSALGVEAPNTDAADVGGAHPDAQPDAHADSESIEPTGGMSAGAPGLVTAPIDPA